MKAAEYARCSTGNQTGNSIEHQLDAIRKYCAENDITITATYIDREDFQVCQPLSLKAMVQKSPCEPPRNGESPPRYLAVELRHTGVVCT